VPEPRPKRVEYATREPIFIWGHGPKQLPAAEKKRCASCSALLASDNQTGIAHTGLCSPCFHSHDSAETTRIGRLIRTGVDPILAFKTITGRNPNIRVEKHG
jgi:hypothetical protein